MDLDTGRPQLSRRSLLRTGFLGSAALALVGSGALGALSAAPTLAQTAPTATPATATQPGPPQGPGAPGAAQAGGDDPSLAQPFVGITTNGTPQPGLFTIQATGVSTGPVVKAAQAFLASLSDDQCAATTFAVDDIEWRKWSNTDFYVRQGIDLEQLNDAQRSAAYDLMGAALSARGLQLSRDIMRLNTTAGELANNLTGFNEFLYWFTVMGTPSEADPWGFQIDGHHLVVNYFVLGDQVVMSPAFFGSEPAVATSGTYAGVSILQEEQNNGLGLINAMPAALQQQAILSTPKGPRNNLAEAFKDNLVLDYAGLRADQLPEQIQTELLDLASLWVNNMDLGHARVRMDEVRGHLNETYFAWMGDTGPTSAFYYRIHSPVVLIEYDQQAAGPIGKAIGNSDTIPTRNHVHSVLRTPNGNDYGKDLLRLHYQQTAHS